MKTILAIILTAAVTAGGTWFLLRSNHGHSARQRATSQSHRRLLYYQSAMHPWIKSDKPGRCTICGMELTPVYEGDPALDANGGSVVTLNQSMIQVLNVQTAEAKSRPLTKTLKVAGVIDDDTSKHRVISAYVAGRIEKLHVNFQGAEVKQGEPLADFYSPALLQAEREYRTLSGELRAAAAIRLRQMGLSAEQIEHLPTKSKDRLTSQILSPASGVVVMKNVYAGQYVQEGERLFEIADFSTMWFQFDAYQQDLPWIRKGSKVEITTSAHPGYVYSGEVSFIDPTLEESTRSAKVRVDLVNPPDETGHRMLHRLFADGLVHLNAPEVMTVPRAAVIETGREAVVYVDRGAGAYARTAIKAGRRGDSLIEVLDGLVAGDKVVVNGNLLIDGQAEMNRTVGGSPGMLPPGMSRNETPLSLPEKRAIEDFVKAADRVAGALAKDDLAAFNTTGETSMTVTRGLIQALKGREDLADILKHLGEAEHLHGAKDLAEARRLFHPFANAAARVLELTGSLKGSPSFDIYECPMVDRAVPGAPKKGRWVQVQGRAISNPYFGASMLDCGSRVKLGEKL